MGRRPWSRPGLVAAIAVFGWAVPIGSASAAAPTNVCTIAGVTKAVASKTFGAPATTTFVPSDGTYYARCDIATAKSVGAQLWLYGASSAPTLLSQFEGSVPKATRAHLPTLGKGALLLHQPASFGTSAATLVLFTRGPYFVAIIAENQYSASSAQLLTLARGIHSKIH